MSFVSCNGMLDGARYSFARGAFARLLARRRTRPADAPTVANSAEKPHTPTVNHAAKLHPARVGRGA